MTNALDVNRRLYRVSLALYPAELRREFGEEMTDVFTQQLSDAWHGDHLWGALWVWQEALQELVCVALPSRVAPLLVVTAATFSATAVMLGLMYALLHGHDLNHLIAFHG